MKEKMFSKKKRGVNTTSSQHFIFKKLPSQLLLHGHIPVTAITINNLNEFEDITSFVVSPAIQSVLSMVLRESQYSSSVPQEFK